MTFLEKYAKTYLNLELQLTLKCGNVDRTTITPIPTEINMKNGLYQ